LCRQGAVELSKIAPLLRAHNIRLIGIGLEETGYQEFLEEKFFDGDIYLDRQQEQYKALGYKKFNICSIWCAVCCNKDTKRVSAEGKKNNIKNNLKGNGFLSGGTLIIEKGGKKVILSYKMQGIADHLENAKILQVLNIDENETIPAKSDYKSAITTQPSRSTAGDN
jgi:prostamide/prostaglandin F2alpha synthase